jgi:hypothetical protein
VTESAFLNDFIALGEARGEARGRIEEARTLVLLFGAKRFGPAAAGIESALLAITDRERLERIGERIMDAADWDDLLTTS